MRFRKQVLANLDQVYSVTTMSVDGQMRVVFASEGPGACLEWTAPDYSAAHRIWEGPGGTMSMVPIPGTNGDFLAVQKFFKMYQWEHAKIVHVRRQGESFTVEDLAFLPYIHRFDLLPVGDRLYFIGCTLATTKESVEDWSNPGKVYVGEFTGHGPLELTVLLDGLTQNHGYNRLVRKDGTVALVTCQSGAYEVAPPSRPGADWRVSQFMDWPISDIGAIDIDGDGELEYATVEPFHGQYFRVWKRIDGHFEKIYEHPEATEFYHVVLPTTLRGEPVFVGGCRRGKQQLFCLQAKSLSPLVFEMVVIEEGVGPSNATIVHEPGRDVIVSANREKGEAALYFFE